MSVEQPDFNPLANFDVDNPVIGEDPGCLVGAIQIDNDPGNHGMEKAIQDTFANQEGQQLLKDAKASGQEVIVASTRIGKAAFLVPAGVIVATVGALTAIVVGAHTIHLHLPPKDKSKK
jgi:hypothetical protein